MYRVIVLNDQAAPIEATMLGVSSNDSRCF